MLNVLIGTASWADRSLVKSGLFYPPGLKTSEERLRYYASQFPIVEVDSSYYAMPSPLNSVLWAERTPDGFVFDIKAFRLFTQHQTPPNVLPPDIYRALGPPEKNVYYRDLPKELTDELWDQYRTAVEPLKIAGKLGVVLFQFPPWFTYARTNMRYVLQCAERLEGYQLAVEFRNSTWFEAGRQRDVLEFERENGLAHVVVDGPQGFTSSVPPIWGATCPSVAVVRLHGRNRETWEMKGLTSSTERFKYLYSEHELRELAGPIGRLADSAKEVHVLFNNNYGNYAQANAAQLTNLIRSGASATGTDVQRNRA